MGKKGDALRAQRAAAARYTFTGAELETRDRLLIERYKNQLKQDYERYQRQLKEQEKELKALHFEEMDQFISEEWKKREAIFRDDGERLSEMLRLLLATSSRVLIEKFHWKPIPEDGNYDGRNRTYQFAKHLAAEVNAICTDERKDIRQYCDETYEKYGVKYLFEE